MLLSFTFALAYRVFPVKAGHSSAQPVATGEKTTYQCFRVFKLPFHTFFLAYIIIVCFHLSAACPHPSALLFKVWTHATTARSLFSWCEASKYWWEWKQSMSAYLSRRRESWKSHVTRLHLFPRPNQMFFLQHLRKYAFFFLSAQSG